jgi:hypothetical protein
MNAVPLFRRAEFSSEFNLRRAPDARRVAVRAMNALLLSAARALRSAAPRGCRAASSAAPPSNKSKTCARPLRRLACVAVCVC